MLKKIILRGIMNVWIFIMGCKMAVSYKKLWKLLIDKDLKKKDLINLAGISGYTLNRLTRAENVNTDTLVKICKALDCQLEDIMELTVSDWG